MLDASPWIQSALQSYVAWILPQVEMVRRMWESRKIETAEAGDGVGFTHVGPVPFDVPLIQLTPRAY